MEPERTVEIGPEGEMIEVGSPVAEPESSPEKRKADQFNTPAIRLWQRPFPDLGGYDTAELYLDPDHHGQWMYTVVMRWTGEPDSNKQRHLYQKMLYGRGFADRESANQAGIENYVQWIEQVAAKRNNPEPINPKEFFVLWGILLDPFQVIALIVYLTFFRNWEGDQTLIRLAHFFVPCMLSLVLAGIATSIKPDPRL